jgi:hypothetical protein
MLIDISEINILLFPQQSYQSFLSRQIFANTIATFITDMTAKHLFKWVWGCRSWRVLLVIVRVGTQGVSTAAAFSCYSSCHALPLSPHHILTVRQTLQRT